MLEDSPKIKHAIETIMDCFAGADGGIVYIKLVQFLEDIHKKSETGNEAATEILNVVYRFENLIKIFKNN